MTMTDFNFQLNTKLPSGALINVRALTAEEFSEHLTQLNELAQEVVDLDAALVAASNVARGGLTVQQPIVASPAAVQTAPAGLGTASDRWGNTYVDGAAGAPLTPRGPAIKRSATSKAGKPYSQWADPCEHPNYTGDRNPADKFERQFAN
jgi:hypothetical protein